MGSPNPSGSAELPLLGMLEPLTHQEHQADPQLERFSPWLFYFLNSETREGPHLACGAAASPSAHHLLSCLHWEPTSQRNSWPRRKKRTLGQSTVNKEAGQSSLCPA